MSLIAKSLPSHGNIIFLVSIPPSVEPITADQVKSWGKIDTDAEDTIIESLIVAVRQVAEPWLGRALIQQTITAEFDWWPENPVKLPRPPLISVSSIYTVDEDDSETTYSSDNYFVRTNTEPGQIVIKNGCSPPINTDRYFGGFVVEYLAGYGDEADDVPKAIQQGLIEWVLDALENRVVNREPPDKALPLLKAYRLMKI
jgi:uncharacterized phiE125 gp8 family phage protein